MLRPDPGGRLTQSGLTGGGGGGEWEELAANVTRPIPGPSLHAIYYLHTYPQSTGLSTGGITWAYLELIPRRPR